MKKTIILIVFMGMLMTGFPLAAAQPASFHGFERIVETGNLVLYYSSNKPAIIVQDKRNGTLWNSNVSEEYYGREVTSPMLRDSMNSLFIFQYTDFDKDNGRGGSTLPDMQTNERRILNGLAVDYYFPHLDLGWSLEISIEDDAVELRIPADSIKEEGRHALVSIELMPFFGAAVDAEDGYIFYPDGSGALLYFKESTREHANRYSWSIYGTDTVDLDAYARSRLNGEQQAMLPVFGLKKGDNAFIAIVNEGEYDTTIHLSLSGYVADLNRIAPEIKYRRRFSYMTPDRNEINYYEREIISTDWAVRYRLLAGTEADYSGMANAYRNYLKENGAINQSIQQGEHIPLVLDLFMGIKEERLIFDKYIAMTTFEQAQSIMKQFALNGAERLEVNLIGWTREGYGAYPVRLPPAGGLGGSRKLAGLAQYAADNGIRLYLQDNFIDAYSQNRGFSKRNETIYHRTGIVATNRYKDAFILNPVSTWDRYHKDYLPRISKLGVGGLNFEKFGTLIYYDYNKRNPVTREQTAHHWNHFMQASKEQLGYAAAQGGNAYLLQWADLLFDIPSTDSGYFFTDESIPFYQMVVHGMLPYCAEPGNLFYDFERQKLKWVEYGYTPYFRLTYEQANLLKYTAYNHLFTSYYEDWIHTAVGIYQEFNDRLGDMGSQVMVAHTKLQEDVYRVSYEDGSQVYVNYREEAVTVDGRNVGAVDYLVVDGRGKEK